jgi:cell division protein FtsI (penicillin-binding protein 3)
MEPPARTQAVTRTTFLAGVAALWASAVFSKLFYLQVVRHKHYAEAASEQQLEMVDILAPRGSIFDRNLEILAMSEPVDSVYVSPMRVPNLAVAADILAPVLHLSRDQL